MGQRPLTGKFACGTSLMLSGEETRRSGRETRTFEGTSGWIMGEADDYDEMGNEFDDFDEEDFDDDFDDDFEEELDDEYEVENDEFPDDDFIEVDGDVIPEEEFEDIGGDADAEPLGVEEDSGFSGGSTAEVVEEEEEEEPEEFEGE